jgi:hypothetical protein
MIRASPAKCKVHEIPEEYIVRQVPDETVRGPSAKNRIADKRGKVVITPDCQ